MKINNRMMDIEEIALCVAQISDYATREKLASAIGGLVDRREDELDWQVWCDLCKVTL